MDKNTTAQADILSVRLSELNLAQLTQVHNLVRKQQEDLAEQSIQLGVQVDALRAQRAALADKIRKHGADLEHLAKLMKLRALKNEAPEAVVMPDDGRTVGQVASQDGTAPGVVLEAAAK